MKESTRKAFQETVEKSKRTRQKVRRLVECGHQHQAEPVEERSMAFERRRRRKTAGAERVQGDTSDFQPVSFLSEGALVRRAVAKVEVNTAADTDLGTGFLVSPELFLTNQHVVHDIAAAQVTTVTFDYEMPDGVTRLPITSFRLAPERFELFSPEHELDFALVALGERIQGPAQVSELGCCPLSDSPDRHRIGMHVNVIQHASGTPKTIAVRNNLLTHRTETTLLYETDTLEGSSGSPVFNDDWDVVALHHYGAPFLELTDEDGQKLPREVNEGVRISSIYRHLESLLPGLAGERRALLERALRQFAAGPVAPLPVPVRRERPPAHERTLAPKETPMSAQRSAPNEMTFVLPIEISVRMPAGCYPPGASAPRAAADATRSLTAGPLLSAEGKKLDRNYANRNGFDADFVDGVSVDLAAVVAPVRDRITHLVAGQPQRERGELKYQNFSVLLDSERRLARITATNIHGATYKSVDRKTGEVREGETWYIDRRVDREAFVDQDFYSGWSHIFDRGHLTRRNDPTWGSKTESERANADTFHFTNCSPQQWRFNQSAEYWQGLERYVLEKGLFLQADAPDLTVLQGPVFDPDEDLWADDLQIPSAFWKLVVWRGAQAPRAVALVASQLELLDEFRGSLAPPDDDDLLEVNQFRISIPGLETLTQLDLSALRPFDTIANSGAPPVGAEALRQPSNRLRGWSDIRL